MYKYLKALLGKERISNGTGVYITPNVPPDFAAYLVASSCNFSLYSVQENK